MALSNLLSFVPNLISAGAGLLSSYQSNQIANKNLEYQKEYNQQVFERSDNAVRRAAADMEAAGLSKTLAAGSPAAVGGNSVVPQKVDTSQIALQNALNISNTLADINMKKAQIRNVNAQTNYQNAVTDSYAEDLSHKWSEQDTLTALNSAKTEVERVEATYRGKILQSSLDKTINETAKLLSDKGYTDKQIELVAEKIVSERLGQTKLTADIKLANIEYTKAKLEYEVKLYDFDFTRGYGFMSSGPQSALGKIATDIARVVESSAKEVKSVFNPVVKPSVKSNSNLSYTNSTDLKF